MLHSIEEFLPRLEHLGMLIYWLAGLAAFLESLAGVGLFVPGTVFVVVCGFVAAQGHTHVVDLIWVAAIGAVLGDGTSFHMGRKGTRLFRKENRFLTTSLLDRGVAYFRRHGGKSIFLGRFFGPLRAVIPFVAGTCRMSIKAFLLWNVLSAIGWAALYVSIGYFSGHAWQVVMMWSSRIGAFVAAVIVSLVAMYLLLRLVMRRARAVWNPVSSIGASTWAGFVGSPEIQSLLRKHPRLFRFLGNRLRIDHFSGLPLSLLLVIFACMLGLLLGLVEDIVTSDPMVAADHRFEALLYVFRNPVLVRVFLGITALGKWQIVVSGAVTASVILFLHKKSHYILSFWLALIGCETTVMVGKLAFHRVRPIHPVYTESSYAFPSGHAAASIVLYGFLAFLVIRQLAGWRRRLNVIFLTAVIIMAIGFSRLYLGVHYLSDVWGGYLLGALWLITAVVVAEWLRSRRWLSHRYGKGRSPSKRVDFSLVALEVVFCAVFVVRYHPPENVVKERPRIILVADGPKGLFAEPNVPRYTETLTGRHQEPISLIIVAANKEAMVDAFRKAGWYLADPVTPRSVLRIAGAALADKEYLHAPVYPSWWNAKVHVMGFEKPTPKHSVRERHHARFWRTRFVTPSGDAIYVGTASLDTGVKWGLTHTISPDIDKERDLIYADLRQTQLVKDAQEFQLIDPTFGHNSSGEPFFTDGKAYWIDLKDAARSKTPRPVGKPTPHMTIESHAATVPTKPDESRRDASRRKNTTV